MNRLILIFSVLFLASCGGQEEESNNPTDSGTVMQSGDLDTCQCQELDIDTLGNHFKEGSEYTGVCVEYYPNSSEKYIEKNLLSGKMHGKVSYYDREGNLLIEEIYEEGNKKQSGEVDVLNCDCSELAKIESNVPRVPSRFFLDDIPYTGTCEKFYDSTDVLYMESNYKDGFLNGRTIYYNRDGSTILIEKYESGQLISTVH